MHENSTGGAVPVAAKGHNILGELIPQSVVARLHNRNYDYFFQFKSIIIFYIKDVYTIISFIKLS
jgi:hypothetical protein